MANPWDNDPIVQPAQPQAAAPWANDPIAQPSPSVGQRALDAVQQARNWLGTRSVNAATGMVDLVSPFFGIKRAADLAGVKLPGAADWILAPGAKIAEMTYSQGVIPKTDLPGPVGKIADAAVEGAMSGMPMQGGLTFGMMLPNAIGGGMSEAAGQMTKGTPYEPFARIGGGVLGGSTAMLGALRPTAGSMVARATGDMSPADWSAARNLQRQSNARGVPLMAHEAMTPDVSSPVGQLFSHVAASQPGGPIRSAASSRIPGMKTAITGELDQIAPKITDPKAVDINLAKAADAAVRQPLIDRVAGANKEFAKAGPDPIDMFLRQNTLDAIKARLAGELPGEPVHAKLSDLHDRIQRAQTVHQLKGILSDEKAILKSEAWRGGPVTDDVRKAVKPILSDTRAGLTASNPEYRAGMDFYKPSHPATQEVDAAAKSGVAQIAGAYQGRPDAASALFGKWIMDPDNARPGTVKADMARLKARDPNAANAALRLYLENIGDAAFKETRGSPAIYGGSNFARDAAGTDMSRANLLAAVEGATGNQTTAAGFANLIDILKRTGVTPGLGSPTATRGEAARMASESGPMNAALESANIARGGPIGPMRRWVQDFRFQKVYGQLADLTTSPDGVKRLHELALLNPQSAKAKALAASILQGALGAQEVTP